MKQHRTKSVCPFGSPPHHHTAAFRIHTTVTHCAVSHRYSDTALMAAVKALNIGALRHPGGTVADYWTMANGSFVGPDGQGPSGCQGSLLELHKAKMHACLHTKYTSCSSTKYTMCLNAIEHDQHRLCTDRPSDHTHCSRALCEDSFFCVHVNCMRFMNVTSPLLFIFCKLWQCQLSHRSSRCVFAYALPMVSHADNAVATPSATNCPQAPTGTTASTRAASQHTHLVRSQPSGSAKASAAKLISRFTTLTFSR